MKKFTDSYLFRHIETIFMVFLFIILLGGMAVYFSYGFTRATNEMRTLVPTNRDEYLLHEMKRLLSGDLEINNRVQNSNYKSLEFRIYYIKKRDTLKKVARRFGLKFDTIVSANRISDARSIEVGRPLIIPNQNGIYYRIRRRDTMTKIVKRFKIKSQAIIQINDIDSADLYSGETIFIPGGSLTRNQREKVMGLEYAIPCVGRVVSGMGWRRDPFHGRLSFHPGVDVRAPWGRPVYAGKSGKVIRAGWFGGYGKVVVIQHRGGYQTWYGHLSKINIRKGRWVGRNTMIGRVGSTGRSVGPHLHFEVRHRGKFINPFRYHGLNRRMWWRR